MHYELFILRLRNQFLCKYYFGTLYRVIQIEVTQNYLIVAESILESTLY